MRKGLMVITAALGGITVLLAASSLPDAMAASAAAKASYVGSDRCKSCHGSEFKNMQKTPHGKVLRTPTKKTLEAPAGSQIRTPADGEARFKLYFQGKNLMCTLYSLDGSQSATYRVYYLVGGAGTAGDQRFLTRVNVQGVNPIGSEDYTHLILPFQYNHNDETRSGADAYSSYYPEHWYNDDGTLIGGAGATPAVLASQFANSWERRCAGCHTTGTSLRYNKRTGMLTDQSTELNVGCEACHGPGSVHAGSMSRDDITNPVDLSAQRALDVCNRCHLRGTGKKRGRYGTIAFPGKAKKTKIIIMPFGQEIGKWFSANPTVWDSDANTWGQYATETNFSASNHQQGHDYVQSGHWTSSSQQMFCWDCHTAHSTGSGPQLRMRADNNTLCLSCHAASGFGSNAAITDHTQHSIGSSRCIACHMPATARSQAWWGATEGDIHSHTLEAVNPNLSWEMARAAAPRPGALGAIESGDAIPNGCIAGDCHYSDSDYGRARWGRWIDAGGGQVSN